MTDFLDPFERMIAALFTPAAVRAAERGEADDTAWSELAASGFLDALVLEDAGGAGLSFADIVPLWLVLGRHAVPCPVGETMIARALLAQAGRAAPDGPIAISAQAPGAAGRVIGAALARHLLVEWEGNLYLAAVPGQADGGAGELAASVRWDSEAAAPVGPIVPGGLRRAVAVLRAALIAGAADRLTTMTAGYANERIQFGKPIGKQQALQQQLAVMAEDMVAARIAAHIGGAGSFPPALAAAATAKSVASSAAARVAAIAHAVHGAIGISEEYDLQLYTRRLQAWRLADGSESYWNRLLGADRLAAPSGSVDFVRAALAPA
ncbi:acyl-CoA dehydrogenase family protein [Sphingopyxis sp. MC1]|uniref:acyl-CoA dehydrogenase family protein n=1 Tax=Sphingopyxis sp. MC1 TaxID=1174684 RepID=UPI0002D1EAEF|nr:acyl-CoA dehydrogenase family protein [Sphingopyxis sp. MC1]ENY81433.1 acyl-CoA dehydrogenase domain-containing protein [Sphingopyxis sp. MC1]